MSMSKSGLKSDQRGQASVEALLVLMILALVIFGGIELSQGIAVHQALDSGSGAASRALSLDPSRWTFAEALVQQAVDQNVMGTGATVTLYVYDSADTLRNAAWLSGSPFGTAFVVEASAPFHTDIPFLLDSAITIRVRHWGIIERYP